jgi:hypothetical protein
MFSVMTSIAYGLEVEHIEGEARFLLYGYHVVHMGTLACTTEVSTTL